MEKLALEIVYHLADLQYERDEETGQRWPMLLSCEKSHILSFRSVCRAFRDASWIPFRDLLAERIFYLNEEDLSVLCDISVHPRLGFLINTLTFGSQVFTSSGLRILVNGLQDHPAHDEWLGGSGAWQRTLSSRSSLPYDELREFKELYERGLKRQEHFWESGGATSVLSDCLYRLSKQGLRAIRICPRPCHVTFEVRGESEKRLSFSSRNRTSHFIPHGAVNHTRCNAWRNIDRTLGALGGLNGSLLQLEDLRTSSVSNVRWPMHSAMFKNPSLFANMRTLQLSIREDVLADDCIYAQESSEQHTNAFVECLMQATNLKSLDLEMCSMGEDTFASYALARIAEHNVPFRLEHLVLEYNVQSEDILTRLISSHTSTLKRLLLMNTWITLGTWESWLQSMVGIGLNTDTMEIWKPCQGFAHEITLEEVNTQFKLRNMSKVAKEGKVVCCLPQEQWDNCYPRYGMR